MRRPRLRRRAIAAALVLVVLLSLAGTVAFLVYRSQQTLGPDRRERPEKR